MSDTSPKSTSAKSGKAQPKPKVAQEGGKKHGGHRHGGPCPWLCNLVPTNVPSPGTAQAVLHPRKDVFVLKVAKVGPNGDRRCKMELELVTPKFPEKILTARVDTRETQCEPEPAPCCCCMKKTRKKFN